MSLLSTAEGYLKELYKDGITRLSNMEATSLNELKTDPQGIGGKGAYFTVNVGANERGTGNISELEALHQANVQETVKGRIQPKIIEHTIRASGLGISVGDSLDEAVAETLQYQFDEGLINVGKEKNAQLYRDGTGRLAQVNGAVSGDDDITIDNGVGTHLRVGMYVDVYLSTTKEVDSKKIIASDPFANTIKLESAVTCSDNAWIFREDVTTTSTGSTKEVPGFLNVTDDGTLTSIYEAVDRTVYNLFDGLTIDANSANLSDDLLQDALSRVLVASGKKPKKLFMNPAGQFRKYLAFLTPMKTFRNGDKLDSGYTEMPTHNGMTIIDDSDCGFSDVFLIDTDDVKKFVAKELHWDDQSGAILKQVDMTDSFWAYAKEYYNVGSRAPNRSIRIKNLNRPTYTY